MVKRFFILLVSLLLLTSFISCKTMGNKNTEKSLETKQMAETREEIRMDDKGNKLSLFFNFKEEVCKISFNGEEAHLSQQVTASGYRYSNEEFELDGKGEEIWLRKNNELIFHHLKK